MQAREEVDRSNTLDAHVVLDSWADLLVRLARYAPLPLKLAVELAPGLQPTGWGKITPVSRNLSR
jgi:hypothetical protein